MLSISSDPQRTKVRMLDASAKELCDPDQHTLLPPIPANDNAADRPWLTNRFQKIIWLLTKNQVGGRNRGGNKLWNPPTRPLKGKR